MGFTFVGAIIVLVVSTAMFVHFLAKRRPALLLAFLVSATAGVVLLGATRTSYKEVNDAYAAAARQSITITVEMWQQVPVATEPCRVTLQLEGRGKSAKLILPNSGKAVTPSMLATVCDTG